MVFIAEKDVHDVFNIFMCTSFDRKTDEYMIKASPARKGDFIQIYAEIDLLIALSVCPCGDVSIPCGEPVPDSLCHAMEITISQT